jgi:hypothetical protein
MLRRFVTPILLLTLALGTLPARAADAPLDAVSTEASAVIRVRKPKTTIDKVAELADLIMKGLGDHVRGGSAKLGELISNPTLAGVDMEADWWVAVYAAGGEEEPDVVFIIPATDLKAMKAALEGSNIKFMESGKFGVYTADEAAATKTAARLKGEGKSIATLIDKDSQTVFDSGDVEVFINVAQLAVAYKSRIDEWKESVLQNLENAPIPGAGSGFDPQQLSQAINKVFALLVQGMNDALSCTISTTISKEGLSFEDLVRLKAGTATDKLLAKSAPNVLSNLAALPAGNLLYFGLAWDMSDFANLGQGAAPPGVKPDAAKELEAATKEMAKLKLASVVSAFGLGDIDGGAVRSVTVTEVDNPAKMRELSQKISKAAGNIESEGIKQSTTVKPDAEKYGKNSADVVTVKTEIDNPQNPLAGMMERVNTVLYGPDGMVSRYVYLKDKVVQSLGGGKQPMTDVLAALERKPSDNDKSPAQQKTRGKLGAKANVLVLFDIPNTIGKILGMVVESQVLPPVVPIDPDQVKDLQAKPSYFGLSAATEPQGLRVKTVIPVEQMQGIAKIVQFVQGIVAGFGAGAAEEQ